MRVKILKELPFAEVGEEWEFLSLGSDKAFRATKGLVQYPVFPWPHNWPDPIASGWVEEVKTDDMRPVAEARGLVREVIESLIPEEFRMITSFNKDYDEGWQRGWRMAREEMLRLAKEKWGYEQT